MKLRVKIQLLKFCSHVFNSFFLALGLSIAGCAVWILFSGGGSLSIIPSEELHTVGVGLLVIGGVVLLVALIGCTGTNAENRQLLLTYLSLLIVLVLGQLFVTLLLILNRFKIEQSLDDAVDNIILHYGNGSDSQDRLMDSVQSQGRCCGRTGPADWLKNSYIRSLDLNGPDVLPCSCFNSTRPSFNSTWCSELFRRGNDSYDQGCKETLSDWLQENFLTIVSMDVGLIVIQMVQFIISLYLYRKFGTKAALKKNASLANSGHANEDHAHLNYALEDDWDYGDEDND